MSQSSETPFTFEGFEPSNTTPVPDILFDELLTELSGAELKVLLYIIRRTWGFKKSTDAISLTQFEDGITTREGKVLDHGCGLNRETICKALQSLEEKGCIKSQKRTAHKRDKDVTVYSIHFKGDKTVVGKSDQGSRKIRPAKVVGKSDQGSRKIRKKVVGKSDPQETVLQETVLQESTADDPEPGENADTSAHTSLFSSEEMKEKVYTTFDGLFQGVLGNPEYTLPRSKDTDTAIQQFLTKKGSPDKLKLVFMDMWNQKDRDGTHFWREHGRMKVKSVFKEYDDRIVSIERKRREKAIIIAGSQPEESHLIPTIPFKPRRTLTEART